MSADRFRLTIFIVIVLALSAGAGGGAWMFQWRYVTTTDGGLLRFNRFTGAEEVYACEWGDRRWARGKLYSQPNLDCSWVRRGSSLVTDFTPDAPSGTTIEQDLAQIRAGERLRAEIARWGMFGALLLVGVIGAFIGRVFATKGLAKRKTGYPTSTPESSAVARPTLGDAGIGSSSSMTYRDGKNRTRHILAAVFWATLVGVYFGFKLLDGLIPPGNRLQDAFIVAFWLMWVLVIFYAVARAATSQGRKWYEVFGIFVPFVGFSVLNAAIWYWAGLAVGMKPKAARSTTHTALTPEAARARLAGEAAEAIRAAEERSAH